MQWCADFNLIPQNAFSCNFFFLHLIDPFTLYVLLYAPESVVISIKEFFRILSHDLHWKKQNVQANEACCRAKIIPFSSFLQSRFLCAREESENSEVSETYWKLLVQYFSPPSCRMPSLFITLEWEGEKEVLPESRSTFDVATARTSGLVNLVLSRQTVFSSARIRWLINEPAVASAWLLGLDWKLYPSNMSRMLSKDLTRFMPSWVRQYRAR